MTRKYGYGQWFNGHALKAAIKEQQPPMINDDLRSGRLTWQDITDEEDCPACNALGYYDVIQHSVRSSKPKRHTCGFCEGTGQLPHGVLARLAAHMESQP